MFSTAHPEIAPKDILAIKRAAFEHATKNIKSKHPSAQPSHSLYPYYEALRKQYSNLDAEPVPPSELLEAVKKRAAEIEQQQAAQQAELAKQSLEFAQINWQDFTVVETIVFHASDLTADLPRAITEEQLQKTPLDQRPTLVQTLASGFIISPFTGDKIATSEYDEHVKQHLGSGAQQQPQETPSVLRYDDAEENLRQWKKQKQG